MTRFTDFVHSPYHNKHKSVRQLIQYLSNEYPNFNTENLNRNVLFNLLFPQDKFDYKRLSIIFTYSSKLLKEFIIIEKNKEEITWNNLLYINELRKQKALQQLEKQLYKTNQQLQKQPERNATFHYWQYQLLGEQDSLQVLNNQHIQDDLLSQKQRQLDYFYLAEKLRDACEMQVRRSIIQTDYKTRLLDAVLKEVGENQTEYISIPIVIIYYQLYQLLTKKDATDFQIVKQTLQQTEQYFLTTELRTIYNYLQNFCIAQINLGAASFLVELFEIYKNQLDKRLLLENETLSEWHYKNIVTVGLRLREMEWTRDFIEIYQTQLPAESRENAYLFNLASYFYAATDYDQTLELLNRVEFKQEQYNLGAKALLLRTYYDKGEDELLLSLTNAFRQFLGRNRSINSQRVLALRNFVRLVRAVAKLRMEVEFIDQKELHQRKKELEKMILETDNMVNKDWLLKRLLMIL